MLVMQSELYRASGSVEIQQSQSRSYQYITLLLPLSQAFKSNLRTSRKRLLFADLFPDVGVYDACSAPGDKLVECGFIERLAKTLGVVTDTDTVRVRIAAFAGNGVDCLHIV